MLRKVKIKQICAVLGIFFVYIIAGCKSDAKPVLQEKRQEKVKVVNPSEIMIEDKLFVLGNIVPFKEVAITGEISGKVKKIKVYEGKTVKKDDEICLIDDEPFQLAVKKAETALLQAGANVFFAESTYKESLLAIEKKFFEMEKMKIQERQIELELKEKERDYKNKDILYKKEGISTTVFKKVEIEYEETKSKYELIKKTRETENVGFRDEDIKRELGYIPNTLAEKVDKIKEIRTRTEKAKLEIAQKEEQKVSIELKEANMVLSKCVIRTPIDGVVGVKKINEGEMIQKDNPMFVIFATDKVYGEFEVNEQDLARVSLGVKSEINVDAYKDKKFTGNIAILSPVVSQKTRTAVVRVEISNSKKELKPGMFIRGIFYTKNKRKVITIPEKALIGLKGDKGELFFIKDDAVSKKSILIEQEKINNFIVVREGLDLNDRIVIESSGELIEGSKVIIEGSI